jgi:hypothetical protein
MAIPDQEATVSYDAVARLAKPGEVDKQPFFEKRRDRIVEIGRFGEIPQPFDNFRCIRR